MKKNINTILYFGITLLFLYFLISCFGGGILPDKYLINPTYSSTTSFSSSFSGDTTNSSIITTTTNTTASTTTTTTTTTTTACPYTNPTGTSNALFSYFGEQSTTANYDPGYRSYYPNVQYDANAFGDNIGGKITISSSESYYVKPYYKMWVGCTSSIHATFDTDYAYSENGIDWIMPTSGKSIFIGYYHPFLLFSSTGFEMTTAKYRMWNWDVANELKYFESDNGTDWTAVPSGNITNSYFSGSAPIYSAWILHESLNDYKAWVDNNGTIYYTTSTNAINWNTGTAITYSINGSVFFTNGSMTILNNGSKYRMWYSSNPTDGYTYPPYQHNKGISYLESTNGLTWTLLQDLPSIGTNSGGTMSDPILSTTDGNTWRTSYTYTPCVVYDSNQFNCNGYLTNYKMWFSGGNSGDARRIWYCHFNM